TPRLSRIALLFGLDGRALVVDERLAALAAVDGLQHLGRLERVLAGGLGVGGRREGDEQEDGRREGPNARPIRHQPCPRSMAWILTFSSEAGQMPGHAIPSAHAHGGAIMAAQGRPIWARRPGTRRSGMRLGRLASLVAFALSVAAVPAAAQTFVFGA